MCKNTKTNNGQIHILDDSPILTTLFLDWGITNEQIKEQYESELVSKLKEYQGLLLEGEDKYTSQTVSGIKRTINRINVILDT